MTARVFLCVIPVQAGIQWLLRGVRLDPGSALRAVRDDGTGSALRAVRDDEAGSALRAVRDDIRKQVRGVQDDGAGSTLRVVHEDARKYARHCPFAVIPAKAGIQRLLRGPRLDPGSALRAVRDDGAGSALRAVRDDGAGSALHAVLEEGVQECVRRGEVCMVVARGADQPSSASSRARSSSRRKSPAAPGDTRAARLASGVRPTPACPAASAALR